MKTHTYDSIIAQPDSSDDWFVTKLERGRVCYLKNKILTLWKVEKNDTLKIVFKKDITGKVPKEILDADFVGSQKSDVQEEVRDYHKFANNYFENKQEPLEIFGSRGGKTTLLQLKSGEKKHRFNILLNDEAYTTIVQFADSQKKTRNQLIVNVLEQWAESICVTQS